MADVITDLFLLDLSVWSGIIILLLLIGLTIFMYIKRSFGFAGVLCWYIGLLLMYNSVNWLIACIPIFIGILLVFAGGNKR